MDVVSHWDVVAHGRLGAVVVCHVCAGRGAVGDPVQPGERCETCSGSGAIHRPYRVHGRCVVDDGAGGLMVEGLAEAPVFRPEQTAVYEGPIVRFVDHT